MRARLIAASIVCSAVVSRMALADPVTTPTITNDVAIIGGVGAEQLGSASQGTLTAGAHATQTELRSGTITIANAESSLELRSGTDGTDTTARFSGKLEGGYVGVPERPLGGLYADAEEGSRPALDARRDVARGGYTSSNAAIRFCPAIHHGDYVDGMAYFNIAGGQESQEDAKRATFILEMELFYHCHLRNDGPAACMHILDLKTTAMSGGSQAVLGEFSFLRFTGLDLGIAYGELGVGVITDNVVVNLDDSNGKVEGTVTTQDLPVISVGAYDLAVATMVGPIEVNTRAKRSGYVSLDGDMSIEDRASLTATLPLAAKAKLSASAFVARTHWWTSKTDPGSHADTGGGEVALDLAVHDFDVHASTGVARSFYAVLDGSAPDAPALGFRSAIDVKHAIKNWVPR